MPIEAPVEDGCQRTRRLHVGVACKHMRDLVRIFAMDAGERELRKSACGRGIHAGIGRL